MRYQVPQFIEVEDKIFGPLTIKQFIFVAGGIGICFIIYNIANSFYLALPFMLVIGGVSAALAFYKINSRPLLDILESASKYLFASRLYIWQKKDKKINNSTTDQIPTNQHSNFIVPRISESRLKDLAWSLDINETIHSKESRKTQGRESFSDSFKI